MVDKFYLPLDLSDPHVRCTVSPPSKHFLSLGSTFHRFSSVFLISSSSPAEVSDLICHHRKLRRQLLPWHHSSPTPTSSPPYRFSRSFLYHWLHFLLFAATLPLTVAISVGHCGTNFILRDFKTLTVKWLLGKE